MAEIELSVLSQQCLAGRIADAQTLTQEVDAWQQRRNGQQSRIVWQFTTADARVELRPLDPMV